MWMTASNGLIVVGGEKRDKRERKAKGERATTKKRKKAERDTKGARTRTVL